MKLTTDALIIDPAGVEERIVRFISDYLKGVGRAGLVMGISGGVDSAVCAAVCSRAVGPENLLGLSLPDKATRRQEDIEHATVMADLLGIQLETVDITPVVNAVFTATPLFALEDNVANGNVRARARMIILYYYANRLGRLVAGSSDKSEAMLGYFTKWGDICADISPIMDLYKTQVRQLGKHLGLPDSIINKPPSPALWPGQTAKDELGLGYDVLDPILYGLEHSMTAQEIADNLNVPLAKVKEVENRWLTDEHKRRLPLTVKIGYRTVGHDFQIPNTTHD